MSRFMASAILILTVLAGPAVAHDYKVGDLAISHPWSRATPPGAKVAGGFLKIRNDGKVADRLVAGSADASTRVEIHEMAVVDGIMRMRELPKGLEIAPGATLELKPGSYHVMFMDLKQPLKEGSKVKGQLTFEKAGTVEVEFEVQAIAAGAAGHGN